MPRYVQSVGLFAQASLLAWLVVVVSAFTLRGRLFATFVGVLGAIYTFTATSMAIPALKTPLAGVFIALHASVYLHLILLAVPRMRPIWYRALISVPASFFVAGCVLALPWAVAIRLGFSPWAPWLPYLGAAIGLWQSFVPRRHDVHITIDEHHAPAVARHDSAATRTERPLRIVQITDPHLGPFMSVARLADICERAVAAEPDLVFLTGDFLTMESQRDPRHLREALAPLQALAGRTFACFGNHDHEAPEVVKAALAANNIELLNDKLAHVSTEWGEVEILGFDFAFRARAERMSAVHNAYPRHTAKRRLRLALLHDPGAFRHLPDDAADVVFSGHTHGGQLGLVSLGGKWTVPRIFRIPDHGLWAKGRARLYVHRGTGHYGFPLRLGVPSEESVIHVHASGASGTDLEIGK